MKRPSPISLRAPLRHPALLALPLATLCAVMAEDTPAEPAADKPAEPAEESKSEAKSAGPLNNWVEFGVGGTFLDGWKPAYPARSGLPEGAFGGIDGFHYERGLGKDWTFKADGRGLFDNHDYRLSFDFTLPDKAYVRAGYREFRTWSDGAGGFLPSASTWFPLYADPLALDSREFYLEAGISLPKLPRFTLRYSHTEQEGQKGSTIWGDTQATGGVGPRSLVPGLLDVDRVRDLVMVDLEKSFGRTRAGLGVRYEHQRNDDGRFLRRFPGEGPGADRHATQRDRSDAELFNFHASTQTRLSDRLTFTTGYAYTDLETDTSGYRVYGTRFDPDMAQRLPAAGTFDQLVGTSQLRQHVGNLNLRATLAKNLVLVPSVRIEGRETEGGSLFETPARPFTPTPFAARSERELLDVSEALDLRYTGLTNWVFYARGTWLQGRGDLTESLNNRRAGSTVIERDTDDRRYTQKYTGGLNWYPLRRLSFGAEYFHKTRENDFDHNVDSAANLPGSLSRYPAFMRAQSFDTDDVNFRVTWRPRGNLGIVGRYDFQTTRIRSQQDGLAEVEASTMRSHVASGSLSWTPLARLYALGSLSYVWDRTETPVSTLTPAVLDSENDYWTAGVTLGYAADDRTDLEAQYVFYRADNYADNSAFGLPLGAGAEDHGLTAGLVRRLTHRIRLSLRYGYFTGHDQFSGGNRDYTAHVLYSTLQYRF